MYSITSSLKGEVTLVPVNPSLANLCIASLQVAASNRVYEWILLQYAALNSAGLLEWAIGLPMSAYFAIAVQISYLCKCTIFLV